MRDGFYYLKQDHVDALCLMSKPSGWNSTSSLGFSTLEFMYPAAADKKRLVCETCELAKRTRSSYIYSGMRSNVPFYTIHSDVWGPCETTSLNGYRWFLTFIDCSSRYTWLYVMKKKSHVYSCFAIKQWWTSIMHKFRCLDRKEVVEVLFHITILKGKKNKPIIRIPFHLERRIWLQILLLQSILLHPQMGMRCRDPPWHLSFFMFLAYCPYLGWKQRPTPFGKQKWFLCIQLLPQLGLELSDLVTVYFSCSEIVLVCFSGFAFQEMLN